MAERGHRSQLCLAFIGETGSGKSTAINNIVGKPVAEVAEGANAVTKQVQIYDMENDLPIKVVDTRGLGDPDITDKEICKEIAATLEGARCKIHVLVYCISMNKRFTALDKQMMQAITTIFGHIIWSHAIILLTHTDMLEKPTTKAKIFMDHIRSSLQSHNIGVEQKVVENIPYSYAAKDINFVLPDKPHGEGQNETWNWKDQFFEQTFTVTPPEFAEQLLRIRQNIFQRFYHDHPTVVQGLGVAAAAIAGYTVVSVPVAAAAAQTAIAYVINFPR